MSNKNGIFRVLCLALVVLLPVACKPAGNELQKAFPKSGTVTGWKVSESIQSFNRENLFNLVDGQAESFFIYGFESVSVQRYADDAGTDLNVEIWKLATPADAYGLFTAGRAGQPVEIGNDGDTDPGLRISYWQANYFISIYAYQPIADADLAAFAGAISTSLPSGGERPAVVGLLPSTDLDTQSVLFFHEEMSIQSEVWLGGENLLGLDQGTNGAVGRYSIGGEVIHLMLIEYPSAERASAALLALKSGNVEDFVTADVKGTLLGAVFGPFEAADAQSLLQSALK